MHTNTFEQCIYQFISQLRMGIIKIIRETLTTVRNKFHNVSTHRPSFLLTYIYSVCFILNYCSALSSAPSPANDNTAMIVGVLFGGIAIGVVVVLLVLGIVCGVCKLRKWKKHPTSTETDPPAENKSVTLYNCMLHIWPSTNEYNVQ